MYATQKDSLNSPFEKHQRTCRTEKYSSGLLVCVHINKALGINAIKQYVAHRGDAVAVN